MGILETKRVIYQPRRRRQSKSIRMLKMILSVTAIIASCVIAGVAIYILGYARYTRVNLRELTKTEISGYDSRGTLNVTTMIMPGYEDFFKTVEVDIVELKDSKNGSLSNGDKLQLVYTYDVPLAKQLGLKVKAGKEVITVKDLPEAVTVTDDELFADVELKLEGISPMLTASVVNNSTDNAFKTVQFEIVEPKACYATGDEIEIKAICDADIFSKNAYELSNGTWESTKTYTVDAKDKYVSDASDLSADLIEKLKKEGAALFGTKEGDANEYGLRIFSDAGVRYTTDNKEYTFRFTGTNYISSYLTFLNPEYIGMADGHYNDIKIVYDTAISQSDGQTIEAEAVVIYRNIVQHEDGTLDVDLNSGEIISVSRSDADIKTLVKCTNDDQYSSVRLEW